MILRCIRQISPPVSQYQRPASSPHVHSVLPCSSAQRLFRFTCLERDLHDVDITLVPTFLFEFCLLSLDSLLIGQLPFESRSFLVRRQRYNSQLADPHPAPLTPSTGHLTRCSRLSPGVWSVAGPPGGPWQVLGDRPQILC